jgi:hypothetical protein
MHTHANTHTNTDTKACLCEGAEAADLALTLTRTPLLLVCAWSAQKKKICECTGGVNRALYARAGRSL